MSKVEEIKLTFKVASLSSHQLESQYLRYSYVEFEDKVGVYYPYL